MESETPVVTTQNTSVEEETKEEQLPPIEETPAIFKTSTIPQPDGLRIYLANLLTADPYNKFCVDCHHNISSWACLRYGTLVCKECALVHRTVFGGSSTSQLKDIFGEHWDDTQLEAISAP
jgi:hypothetical protein